MSAAFMPKQSNEGQRAKCRARHVAGTDSRDTGRFKKIGRQDLRVPCSIRSHDPKLSYPQGNAKIYKNVWMRSICSWRGGDRRPSGRGDHSSAAKEERREALLF